MTRFSYSQYFSSFRSSDAKRNSSLKTLSAEISGSDETKVVLPIISAVRRGDVHTVRELASVCGSEDWTPLHEAAHCGQTDCVQALLRAHRTCVDKRTLQEQTPLLLAVHGGHLECVRCLLESGADPDICNKHKETPLYKACEHECVSTVKLLLAFGAAVNQRCHRGRTALHEAVRRDNTDLCETLLKAGASVDARDADDITPLIEAARHGGTKTLACLIRNGADVNLQSCDGNSALSKACRYGHREAATLLLKHHGDANRTSSEGLLPLHVATRHGHKEIVSLLLPITSRARIRQSGISPLHVAAEHNQQDIMTLLIESGCDVNAKLSDERSAAFPDRRSTPLYCAIAARNTRAGAALLKSGADPNSDPLSPLLLAARQGCLKTVAMLVEHGANVNASAPDLLTDFPAVLLYTSRLEILHYLLDNGCDAQACFKCDKYHCSSGHDRDEDAPVNTTQRTTRISTKPTVKFCDWISSSSWSQTASSVILLLLDYVGNVQLCSSITDLLLQDLEWLTIQEKTLSPRPLMHLCRLKIRELMGIKRLSSVDTLPLPHRMLCYLSSRINCSTLQMGSSHTPNQLHVFMDTQFSASDCI